MGGEWSLSSSPFTSCNVYNMLYHNSSFYQVIACLAIANIYTDRSIAYSYHFRPGYIYSSFYYFSEMWWSLMWGVTLIRHRLWWYQMSMNQPRKLFLEVYFWLKLEFACHARNCDDMVACNSTGLCRVTSIYLVQHEVLMSKKHCLNITSVKHMEW